MKLWLIVPFLFSASCFQETPKQTLRKEGGQTSKVPRGEQEGAEGESDDASEDARPGKDNDKPTNQIPPNTPNPDPVTTPPSSEKPDPLPPPTTKPGDDTKGITALECKTSAMYRSTKFCEGELEGVAIKWVPLEGDVKPSRIALYLHGDTANDWREPFIAAQFVSWMKKNNVLMVLTRSTTKYDDDAPDEWSYGAAQPEDARKLEKAVQALITRYQTPSDNLLYFGLSGGPWFLSSSWIPLMGGKFPGLYALSCGGSQFWQKFAWDTKGALKDKVKIFYNYGDKDFLAKAQDASVKHFQSLGLSASQKIHPGASHCSHDVLEPTLAFWEAEMKAK